MAYSLPNLNKALRHVTITKQNINHYELSMLLDEITTTPHKLKQYLSIIDNFFIVSATDQHGIIIYVNDQFCEVSEYPRAELVGKTHRLIRHPDEPATLYESMWGTITKGKPWHGTLHNRTKSGSSYYVDTVIVPFFDESGTLSEYVSVWHENTELHSALVDARAAKAAKSAFLANMSHEIRTPMNGILGFIDVPGDSGLTPRQLEYVNIIEKSGRTLQRIIDDILDFSKIESGKLTIERIDFVPVEEFESVIELFGAKAREKHIALLSFMGPDLPREVKSDPVRIKQVIANLLSNAIKFTPENGEIIFEIDAVCDRDARMYELHFRVIDSGIGVDPDRLEAIFDDFEQANSTTSRRYGGTGLGLAISRELVRLMDGTIRADNNEGGGSTFSFNVRVEPFEERNFDTQLHTRLSKLHAGVHIKGEKKLHTLVRRYLDAYGITSYTLDQHSGFVDVPLDLIFIDEGLDPFGFKALSHIYPQSRFIQILPAPTIASALTADKKIALPLIGSRIFDAIVELIAPSTLKCDEPMTSGNRFRGHILAVEDNPVNQELLTIKLGQYVEYFTMTANGKEALDSCQNFRFDLVLMDINMPVMNGLEATRRIRKLPGYKTVPIVALTANAFAEDKARYLADGMDDFISKPIDDTHFADILRKYLLPAKRPNPRKRHKPSRRKIPLTSLKSPASLASPKLASSGSSPCSMTRCPRCYKPSTKCWMLAISKQPAKPHTA